MIDFLILLVIGGVAYCVASEGPWGAALTLLSVVFGGLAAMNFFEPIAAAFSGSSLDSQVRADFVALMGLFTLAVFGLRTATDNLMPTHIDLNPLAYEIGRWGLGLGTGYVTAAFLLTALHTAPMPREFLGFRAERSNLFEAAAPDRQWLGFTQYVSERTFTQGQIFDGSVFERIPGKANTLQVWSSFPIRYAMRREMFAKSGGGGGGGPSAPPRSSNTPPPTGAPSGGGASSGF